MKKILGVLVVALTMISSTFAFGLSIGGRGLLGGKLDLIQDSVDDVSGGNVSLEAIDKLSYGGGAYVYADLFGGLGVQAEASYVTNKFGINYLDIPLMGMLTLNFFDVLSVGVGGGVNFSRIMGSDFKNELQAAAKDLGNISSWTHGLALAADVKIFFTKHIGLVIGARGIIEGNPNKMLDKMIEGSIKGAITGEKFNKLSVLQGKDRKEFYGTLGVEFRLF